MKADLSRETFRPGKHFSSVLMQQGRVLLDSDWNEQASISMHYQRTLARDLIGPFGGPAHDCGFRVLAKSDLAGAGAPIPDQLNKGKLSRNFVIGRGRYYVDGVLCENEGLLAYARSDETAGVRQPDLLADELSDGKYIVYLDVWERHITALEDEEIREVALGAQGPDTATRSKIVWQAKAFKYEAAAFDSLDCANSHEHKDWLKQLEEWQPPNRGKLKAKADEPDDISATNPCIISPDAHYRGAENQLYRVEIHRGGKVDAPATFKWSRENGSVALPIRTISGNQVTLEHLGRDARFSVQVGDWVQIEGVSYQQSSQEPPPLLHVEDLNAIDMVVTLSGDPAHAVNGNRKDQGWLLRRWDQKASDPSTDSVKLRDGAAIIKEAAPNNPHWLTLEDGVQIQFQPGGTYRSGDYWLIPARTATGDVEWPGPLNNPRALPPHGIRHHYAPLARISVTGGAVKVENHLRRKFKTLAECT